MLPTPRIKNSCSLPSNLRIVVGDLLLSGIGQPERRELVIRPSVHAIGNIHAYLVILTSLPDFRAPWIALGVIKMY